MSTTSEEPPEGAQGSTQKYDALMRRRVTRVKKTSHWITTVFILVNDFNHRVHCGGSSDRQSGDSDEVAHSNSAGVHNSVGRTL